MKRIRFIPFPFGNIQGCPGLPMVCFRHPLPMSEASMPVPSQLLSNRTLLSVGILATSAIATEFDAKRFLS